MDVSSMRPSRPLSIAELHTQGENFAFSDRIALKQWAHAAETLRQEATFATQDGDCARAYTMLYRHSILVLKYLPTHPQYKTAEGKKLFKPLSKRIERVLRDLEDLKPELERAHTEWERMKPPLPERPPSSGVPRSYDDYAARDPSLTGNTRILDASENQELAVDLAQEELTRRDTVRRATRQTGLSNEEASARRQAGQWEDWETRDLLWNDNGLQQRMQAARGILPSSGIVGEDTIPQPTPQNYHYPSISRSQAVRYDSPGAPALPERRTQPARPPKEADPNSRYASLPPPPLPQAAIRPPIPEKERFDEPKPAHAPLVPSRPSHPALPPKEPVDAPPLPKKERLTFKPGGYLENGDPIRSLFMPSSLRSTFVNLAADNTRRGVEMCGILCGAIINNALFIRCLLIPQQICTPDTCETENESEYFDYVINEGLIMVGWIHTHPTQTCFMSSRDLHTHAGYQHLMAESIAIVCSPKFQPSYGIFRLTKPPGLEHILACRHSDTFHQHSLSPSELYRTAEHPTGHVYENDKLPFYVHDMRKK